MKLIKNIIFIILSTFLLFCCTSCADTPSSPAKPNDNSGGSGGSQDGSNETDPEGSGGNDGASYRQITMDQAVIMMSEETDYIILDVRRPDEFEEKHIPNAINVPNETIGTSPIPELPRKDQLILVYCRSGNRSKQAASKLAALGYTNVVEFGGILDWKGPTVSGK